ncbi:MAG: hypothetical protein NTW03_05465 [Verrucomicrobia bacterium]|nr:hypothetical protein [Verrucomicrobiota bacterium]
MFRLGPDANPVNIGQATNVIYQNNVQGGYADGANAATNTRVAGQTYYCELIMKQGGGGEYVGLAVRFPGDTRATASLPSFFGLPYRTRRPPCPPPFL